MDSKAEGNLMRRWRRLRLWFVAVASMFAASAATPALALHATCAVDPWSFQAGDCGTAFSVGASLGQIAGSGAEKVFYYPQGNKFQLSDLKWDFKGVTVAGVTASAGFGGRYRLSLGYWSAFYGGSGLMVDRDWLYDAVVAKTVVPDDANWTDESRHPDTSLDKGTMLDLNLNVMALRAGPFSLRGILGFKRDAWNWSARGGTYIYSSSGFRDSAGTFEPGVQVIEYKQTYAIPYLGIGANWSTRTLLTDVNLLLSPAVWASDTDYHDLRETTFKGDFFGGIYVGLGLTVTWAITEHWAASIHGEYQSISGLTGDETMITPDSRQIFKNGSGVGMDALMYSLGTSYRF